MGDGYKRMDFPVIDCYDCGGLLVIGKWYFCTLNHNQKIIILPWKGQCKLKPNNAQTKLK
jgi:hypothetical protein